MQILINIPDFMHRHILKRHVSKRTIAKMFENGIVLPKGHGRLIDANRILNCNCKNSFSECDSCLDSELCALLNEVPTVIEADKEDKK